MIKKAAEMVFSAATLNVIRKMNMVQTEVMMKLRQRETREEDLLSRLGNSDGDGDGGSTGIDCSLKLGIPHENPTHHSTIFYGASRTYPQVRNNHGLISGASAFRPWAISSSDHVACNNSTKSNTGSFVDFLGSTPVLASVPPPLPIIPILSAKCSGYILSLAPASEAVGTNKNPFQRGHLADQADPHGSENGKACSMCKRGNTPLWRNGPHGPKTLCNACGIRFRKKEKKALGNTEEFPRPRDGIKKPRV